MDNLTNAGIKDLKDKINKLHESVNIKPDASIEQNLAKVKDSLSLENFKNPHTVRDEDLKFEDGFDITESDIDQFLPTDSWIDSIMPDFKKLIPF